MKKFAILLLMLVTLNVNAIVNLECTNLNVKNKEEFTCHIKTNSNITYLEGSLNYKHAAFLRFNRATSFTNNNFSYPNFKLEVKGNATNLLGNIKSVSKSNTDVEVLLTNMKYKTSKNGKLTNAKDVKVKVNPERKTTTTKKVYNYSAVLNYENDKTETLSCSTEGLTCKIDLTKAEKPRKIGFTFTGWGNEKECIEGSLKSYTASEDVQLFPCFKESEIDTSITLDNLVIENHDIKFNKDKLEYNLEVNETITSLNITPTSSDDIEVVINNKELVDGLNTITILLIKEDKINKYIINVNKINNELPVTNISIKGVDFKFNPAVFKYNIVIPKDMEKLDIEVLLLNENYEYEILGNENLKDGDVVTIKVVQGEREFEYILNITKDNNKLKIYIMLGLLILLFVLIVIVIIIKVKEKKKNNEPLPKQKEEKDVEVLETL